MVDTFAVWFCYVLVSKCATVQKHHNEMSDRNGYVVKFDNQAVCPT